MASPNTLALRQITKNVISMGKRRNKLPRLVQAANDTDDDTTEDIDPLAMVEHSINKYEEKAATVTYPVVPTYQHHPQYSNYPPYRHTQSVKKYWSKTQILDHIKKCEEEGLKKGARVRTDYGSEGIILDIMDVPENGIDYWGMGTPSVFKFQRDNAVATNIFYKKEELTLI